MAMTMKEIQAVAEQLRNEAKMAYNQGVREALLELREVYGEGIELTDLWASAMDTEEEAN